MTRDAFAAEGRRQQITDRSKQQLSIDGTDRQTDGQTDRHPTVTYYAGNVNNSKP